MNIPDEFLIFKVMKNRLKDCYKNKVIIVETKIIQKGSVKFEVLNPGRPSSRKTLAGGACLTGVSQAGSPEFSL
jgi:hypothetical protein